MLDHVTKRQEQAKVLRVFRKIHRVTGALLFVFFFVVAVTGLLLGWKKNSKGLLLAKSYKGSSTLSKDWLSVDSLSEQAVYYLKQSDSTLSTTIDRIDFRPEKGMVKFLFTDHFTAVQIDAATGALLHIEKRRADYIEKIHDGSLVDHYLDIPSGTFKLIYTTIMGLALLLFTITGFWLWYGPKRMRANK
ncbi:MAG: PepSY domain-containing protein [Chitinophagaceae bacterium]|nr:PepSY domain-containing protein [Chitinophagaceae bacterium]